MSAVHLLAFGLVDEHGLCGSSGLIRFAEQQGAGPLPMRWRRLFESPNDRFGQMDRLSQCVLAAAEIAGLTVSPDSVDERTGIVMGTNWGCVDADVAHYVRVRHPAGPSPLLFAPTLPSAAIGELAVRYGFGGPNLCLMCGADSGTTALREAWQLIQAGELVRCLCVMADAVDHQAASLLAASSSEHLRPHGRAVALLLASAEVMADQAPHSVVELCEPAGPTLPDAPIKALIDWLRRPSPAVGEVLIAPRPTGYDRTCACRFRACRADGVNDGQP
jgi:hypothetical protein